MAPYCDIHYNPHDQDRERCPSSSYSSFQIVPARVLSGPLVCSSESCSNRSHKHQRRFCTTYLHDSKKRQENTRDVTKTPAKIGNIQQRRRYASRAFSLPPVERLI